MRFCLLLPLCRPLLHPLEEAQVAVFNVLHRGQGEEFFLLRVLEHEAVPDTAVGLLGEGGVQRQPLEQFLLPALQVQDGVAQLAGVHAVQRRRAEGVLLKLRQEGGDVQGDLGVQQPGHGDDVAGVCEPLAKLAHAQPGEGHHAHRVNLRVHAQDVVRPDRLVGPGLQRETGAVGVGQVQHLDGIDVHMFQHPVAGDVLGGLGVAVRVGLQALERLVNPEIGMAVIDVNLGENELAGVVGG